MPTGQPAMMTEWLLVFWLSVCNPWYKAKVPDSHLRSSGKGSLYLMNFGWSVHRADIRTHPVYIRAVIDGATHEAAVKAAMEVNAGRGSQDAKRLISAFDSAEGLEKQERLDHEVEGQVNPPDAKGKTIAVNLAAPRPAAYHERFEANFRSA